MVTFLSKLFIKDRTKYEDAVVRNKYGVLCGAVGILLNAVLFVIKIIAGMLTGSIAVTADAFNNLSDAGSSLISIIGFRLSSQKPDSDHPFGHGRIEYVSSLIIAMLILLMAFELMKSSAIKIFKPEKIEFNIISIAILVFSIGVKIYMYMYNRSIGKKIGSSSMSAVASDSLFDSVATSAVLLSMVLFRLTGINADGYCGCVVALFIFYGGFGAAKDTISPLLGQPVKKEFAEKIEKIVMSNESIIGIHDLIVHDYGPGRLIVSLHAEVPSSGNMLELHDDIDNVERLLKDELGCLAVIHMDPVQVDDIMTSALKMKVASLVKTINNDFTIHDFRIVNGKTHTNLIFDVVVPFSTKMSDAEVRDRVSELVSTLDGNCYAVITIDKNYIK